MRPLSPEEVIRIKPYEIMLMIEPDVAEERHQAIIDDVKATVSKLGGEWHAAEPWGKRKLAYEIDHKPDAWYYLLTFDAPTEALAEVTRRLAIADGVMRHMAVNRIAGQTSAPAPAAVAAEA